MVEVEDVIGPYGSYIIALVFLVLLAYFVCRNTGDSTPRRESVFKQFTTTFSVGSRQSAESAYEEKQYDEENNYSDDDDNVNGFGDEEDYGNDDNYGYENENYNGGESDIGEPQDDDDGEIELEEVNLESEPLTKQYSDDGNGKNFGAQQYDRESPRDSFGENHHIDYGSIYSRGYEDSLYDVPIDDQAQAISQKSSLISRESSMQEDVSPLYVETSNHLHDEYCDEDQQYRSSPQLDENRISPSLQRSPSNRSYKHRNQASGFVEQPVYQAKHDVKVRSKFRKKSPKRNTRTIKNK